MDFCTTNTISFSYDTSSEPLFVDLSITIPRGWTGLVGANGTGKTTLLRILLGELEPQTGSVQAPSTRWFCPQDSVDVPEELADLVATPTTRAYTIMSRLGVDYDWPYRWETLSFGERKRAQIASALWFQPDLLALDEPTNHLDRDARERVRSALQAYEGVGIIVSHDRKLLDAICDRCLFFDLPASGSNKPESGRNGASASAAGTSVTMRPGGVSAGLDEAEREAGSARHAQEEARRELKRVRAAATARKALADSAASRVSKRHIARGDRDRKGKIDLARVTGKDAVGGRLLRQMESRLEPASQQLNSIAPPPKRRLGISAHGRASRSDSLLDVPAGRIDIAPDRTLSYPELVIHPTDRIALTGPNGAGKSTLIRWIVGQLESVPSLYLPQELSRTTIEQLVARLASADDAVRGSLLSVVSRLGSDPERVLDTSNPSPGEARKLLLAFGLTDQVELIIMDEPTNHMDLPSVLCLEDALAEVECGLLFASHDERFIERLGATRWEIIVAGSGDRSTLHVVSG